MVVLRGCLDGLPDQLACLLSLKPSPYRKSHCFCLLFEEDYCDDEQQTEAATLQNTVASLYCNTPKSVDPMGSTLVVCGPHMSDDLTKTSDDLDRDYQKII